MGMPREGEVKAADVPWLVIQHQLESFLVGGHLVVMAV